MFFKVYKIDLVVDKPNYAKKTEKEYKSQITIFYNGWPGEISDISSKFTPIIAEIKLDLNVLIARKVS